MLRNDVIEMIALAERLLAARGAAVLATLFSVDGSTYRQLGSMMLGGPSSAYMAGAVSGGCLEEYILRQGRALTSRQPAALLRFDADPLANPSDAPALGCGGSIEVLVEHFTHDHLCFLQDYASAQNVDRASVAACIIDRSGPGICVHRTSWADAEQRNALGPELELLRQSANYRQRSAQSSSASQPRVLMHYVPPPTRLLILGAGNDAQPLCALGRSLGWHVCVADRRARLATSTRFPEADQVLTSDWLSVFKTIRFTTRTAVVMMTHSIEDDLQILPLLVHQPAAYIGALGPRHRLEWLLRDVDADLPDCFVNRLRGPIGLDLGDRSPGGIAVSIIAEILTALNGRSAEPLGRPAGEFDSWQQTVVIANE